MSVFGDRRSREQKAKQEQGGQGTDEGHDQEGRSGVDSDRRKISSSSRKELAGTHGQRCGGSYCPNQLIMCIFRHSGLITEIKCFVVLFIFFSVLSLIKCIIYSVFIYFVVNFYVGPS